MVSPLRTIIAYLLSTPVLQEQVGTRIDTKQQYGLDTDENEAPQGWPLGNKALTVAYSTGSGVGSVGTNQPYPEARCYGKDQTDAEDVYLALLQACGCDRTVVDLPDGTRGLLYWLIPGDPTFEYDPDLHMDIVRIPLRANVATDPV